MISKSDNVKAIKATRIFFLDYLRIFAFVSVLIGHKFNSYLVAISNDVTIHSTPRLMASFLIPFMQSGGAGVVVFFLVSGYIITHVLQTEHSVEFLIKRIFRIYPLYIVAVLLWYIPLAIVGHTESVLTLILQLLLLGDFFGTPYALGGVEWTLRVEIIFYVFMMALSYLNIITNHKSQILPYLLVFTTLMLGYLAPIPTTDIFKGYITIFAPFLLLGSMIYLFERKKLGLIFLLFFISLVFC